MAKNIYYKYNPVTDSFERFYPSFKTRLVSAARVLGLGLLIGIGVFLLIILCFSSPTEENLRAENSQLKSRYNVLERRLDRALKVMSDIQTRDDNFYRVIMQLDPVSRNRRLTGLDDDNRYRDLQRLPDADLMTSLSRRMDLLDRQIYAQSMSFSQLKEAVDDQNNKLAHIPAIMPLDNGENLLSSGFGSRRDPLSGETKFHTGFDFAAPEGTPVYATGSGVVKTAGRKEVHGNTVEIDHGYQYTSLYSHLSAISVKENQQVKRGELIGYVGSTGKSSGAHLHYEVIFKEKPQNPVNYLFKELDAEQYSEMIRTAENAAKVMD